MPHIKIEILIELDFRTKDGLLFICYFILKILPIPDSRKYYCNK